MARRKLLKVLARLRPLGLTGNAGLGKGGHLRQADRGGFDEAHRQHRTRTLTQPHAEIQEGPQSQVRQHSLMPRLDRQVRGNDVVFDVGQRLCEMRPAAPEMKPSSTTGRRASDPPNATPASTPISNPPTLLSTSSPSLGSG